jgi:hypothetical protein
MRQKQKSNDIRETQHEMSSTNPEGLVEAHHHAILVNRSSSSTGSPSCRGGSTPGEC